jgi:hypothetical protein
MERLETLIEKITLSHLSLSAAVTAVALFFWSFTALRANAVTVITSVPIGTAVDVSLLDGNLTTRPKSHLKTTTGVYVVEGIFQVTFANQLKLEKRANLSWKLCDRKLDQCLTLIQ